MCSSTHCSEPFAKCILQIYYIHIVKQEEVVTYMCEWNRQCIIMCSCWSVMHTMLKRHAQKWCYAWNAETLIYIVKGRNVHTCNSSEHEHVITHRAHDNSWTTDLFCLSWALHTGTTETRYYTCSFTNNVYIDQLDLSSCLRHPNWYPWILPLCVFSFNLFCPCLCSAF